MAKGFPDSFPSQLGIDDSKTGIKYRVKIEGGLPAIQKKIKQALVRHFMGQVNVVRLRPQVHTIFMDALRAEPEYASLMGMEPKSLRGHFGIANLNNVEEVVQFLAGMIRVERTSARATMKEVRIGVSIVLDARDLKGKVDNFAPGIQQTEKGEYLPWLRWLLFEGGRTVIQDYIAIFRPGAGRSGEAVMVKIPKRRWRIPGRYKAGTQKNNWFTRAAQKSKPHIQDLVQQMLIQDIR